MAAADYRLCDKCGGKTFYDANLNYGNRHDGEPYREAGQEQTWNSLEDVGDWAVLCRRCAKTHRTAIAEIAPTGRSVVLPQELIAKFEQSSFCPNDLIRGRPETGTAWNTLATEYVEGDESNYSCTLMYYVLHHDGVATKATKAWGEMSGKHDAEFVAAVVGWFQSMTQARQPEA